MKAFLLYEDRDFDFQQSLPLNELDLRQDLALDTLFDAMSLEDKLLFDVARKVILVGSKDLQTILYRQQILKDCLQNPELIRTIYHLTIETIEQERKNYWGILSKRPSFVLSRSIGVLQMFTQTLGKLRKIADEHAEKFASAGFVRFFSMLREELTNEYFLAVKDHLRQLQFRRGVLISARLGKGCKGSDYVLRKPEAAQSWIAQLFTERTQSYTFHISERDQAGMNALEELRGRGINQVANALAQSNDHILSFFVMLRNELSFYMGCLNLHERLSSMQVSLCFPTPANFEERIYTCKGLYDVCLALTLGRKIVGNDLSAKPANLVVITGANQGGKSTFLRSIGLSQMLMQCGMFVPADSFASSVCDGLFTHFRREEDATMTSGKLDEELSRMSTIVDQLNTNSMILFNESFAATNEREGSEIARQITHALLEKGIRVFFCHTHVHVCVWTL